uniref:Ceramide kinase C-terminal domain-containing protein n=1 Tax=Oncorhynchus tshawytscha TaxID=74940 RepID=A0A8C8ES99_ONCTS
ETCRKNFPKGMTHLIDQLLVFIETSGDCVWRLIRGKFLAINAAGMSCACPCSPRGQDRLCLLPSANLADGITDLILVREASRLDFLRHLIRHTNKDDHFDMSFMEVHRVREIRFVPKHSNVISEVDPSETSGKKICNQVCTAHPSYDTGHSNWNCDEEIMPHAAIHVRYAIHNLNLLVLLRDLGV